MRRRRRAARLRLKVAGRGVFFLVLRMQACAPGQFSVSREIFSFSASFCSMLVVPFLCAPQARVFRQFLSAVRRASFGRVHPPLHHERRRDHTYSFSVQVLAEWKTGNLTEKLKMSCSSPNITCARKSARLRLYAAMEGAVVYRCIVSADRSTNTPRDVHRVGDTGSCSDCSTTVPSIYLVVCYIISDCWRITRFQIILKTAK
jgi:hypothetical protein